MRTRGEVSGMSWIFWTIILIFILLLFGSIILFVHQGVERGIVVEDSKIYWEANYLALSLVEQEITLFSETETLARFLSTKEEFNPQQENEMQAQLTRMLRNTLINRNLDGTGGESSVTVLIFHKEELLMCVQQRRTDFFNCTDKSTILTSRGNDPTIRFGYDDLKRRSLTGSDSEAVTWLPNDSAVMVVIE